MKSKELAEGLKDLAHREVNPNTRIIASCLIIISGVLLFLDKILTIVGVSSPYTFGFELFADFVWVFCQSIAPIIMIIGVLLKPYYTAFLVPVYCYAIQIIWVFRTDLYFDDPLLHLYALGSCLLFVLLSVIIVALSQLNRKKQREHDKFIQEMETSINLLTKKLAN